MSDIAKKTLPPGSWPGSKGGETSEAGRDIRSAPRSVASPSVAKDGGKGSTAGGDDHFEDVQSDHYTHDRENPLHDIQEESSSGLKNVEPQPMSNGITDGLSVQHQAEEEENAPEEVEKEEPVASEHTGSNAALTESAKEAFDLASQNQPTEEAHDAFLETAASKASGKSPVPEGVDDKTIGPQDSITEAGPAEGEEVPAELLSQQAGTGHQEPLEALSQPAGTGLQEPLETQAEEIEIPTEHQELPTEAEIPEATVPESAELPLDFSILKNGTVNKGGNIINEEGKLVGRVTEGILARLIGKRSDENGVIWDDRGRQVGKCEPISDKEREEMLGDPSPFEAFPNNVIDADGMVRCDGELIGRLVEGDAKALRGKTVDADGDVLDKAGNVCGRAERWEPEPEAEPEVEPQPEVDMSALAGGTVTSKGYVIDKHNRVVGRVVEGILANLINKRVDETGQIWSDGGKVIGRAEILPENERDELEKESGPFSSFPDAIVGADGWVLNGEHGEVIGKVVEGDAKALRNKTLEADGRIVDNVGRQLGRAERWEPEPEAEVEPTDYSILAGKRVNKAGWVVDSNGQIFGKVVEGDVKNLVGRMCNKNGQILSESGDVIGRAELVSEGEREGLKEGPFAGLTGLTVAKGGLVVTPSGDVVGRLTQDDPKNRLVGRTCDEDGDIVDANGNVLAKAERWEPEEVEKATSPLAGRRVNKKGEVVDADGNLIGKLTTGNLQVCSGKEIDDDGDVVDSKGVVIGHVSLLEDIPDEEVETETETEDEKKKREQMEQDRKLAAQMAVCIEQCLDKIRPICKMISEKLDWADRKRQNEEEIDEDALVREIRPLIEEGGRILQEAKGIIKGLDPDGRISANAKHKTAAREATPEEYRLADLLKDLTGEVTQTIENAQKRLEDYPHAKKELNPLWGLLNEPLFQILAAVGLLLNGVLSLVGRLLSGLGLGGLLDGLLGTLGLNRVLEGLGLGSVTDSLRGGKKKGSGGGGLLGGLLGGGK